VRVDLKPEQHLCPVRRTHTGDHGLVHQQLTDRDTTAQHPVASGGRIRIWSQWVRAQPSVEIDLLIRRHQVTCRRPSQVEIAAVSAPP
jgi:hypothetical protein